MPGINDLKTFTKTNVKAAPDESGVYTLCLPNGRPIYIGRTKTGETIRSELQDHFDGNGDVSGIQRAQWFGVEADLEPVAMEKTVLADYAIRYGGVPECNPPVAESPGIQ
jgi:excinuclease UvrABC nuclease subunit